MQQNIPKKISFILFLFSFILIFLTAAKIPTYSQTYTCSWVEGETLCYFNENYNQDCPEGYEPQNCSQFTNTTYEDCQMDPHECTPLPTTTPTPTIGPTPTGGYTCPICKPAGPGERCANYGLIGGSGTCPQGQMCCQVPPTPIPTEGPGEFCEGAQTGGDGQPVCRIPNYSLCPHDPTICCHNDHMDNCPGPKHENCILNPNEPGPCPDDYPVMCAGTGYCCLTKDDCRPIFRPNGWDGTNPFCSVNGIENAGINTAIGCIPITGGNAFVEWFFPRLLGVMGGIAFLLMLYGGFLVLTSAGNPEKVKAGQETITAAIAGLVFAIFSLFVLQLVGVQILQIPGLG